MQNINKINDYNSFILCIFNNCMEFDSRRCNISERRNQKHGDENHLCSIFIPAKAGYSYFIAAVILKYSITVLVSFFNSPFLSALWLIFVTLIYLTGSPGDS
jgi:hypothetical protein